MANTFDLDEGKTQHHWQTFKKLCRLLWPQNQPALRVRVVFSILCLILAKVLSISIPFFYKYAVDALSLKATILVVPVFLIVAYGVAMAVSQLFGEFRDLLFVKVGQHALRHAALDTFKHLHQLSLKFHLDRQTGGLARIIDRAVQAIQFVLWVMLFNILPNIFELIVVCIIFAVKFNLLFAAVAFLTVFSYLACSFLITEWRMKFRRAANQASNRSSTISVDSLLNFETVKYFNNEQHEFDRYNGALKDYQQAMIKAQYSLSGLNSAQALIISVGLSIIMLLAARGIVHQQMSIGDFVLVNMLMMQLYQPLRFIGAFYNQVKQSLTDMEKMFELVAEKTEEHDSPNAPDISIEQTTVAFDCVSFHYQAERTILTDVSFEVPAGKTVAIVGPSGSGKSTISRLLFRFYDPQSGSIKVAGQDIKNFSAKSLRTHVGIVPQDTVLFNDTLAYNIGYAKPDCSLEELKQVTDLAHLSEFVKVLPDGYDTLVGERGLKLSGGEKQRVAIARMLLKNPKIMIFDEATSSLDSHTEKEIQKSIAEISKNRTTVMIAHRLSTVVHADNIIVLRFGKIVEQGTHQQLLKLNNVYASMWQQQKQDAQPE